MEALEHNPEDFWYDVGRAAFVKSFNFWINSTQSNGYYAIPDPTAALLRYICFTQKPDRMFVITKGRFIFYGLSEEDQRDMHVTVGRLLSMGDIYEQASVNRSSLLQKKTIGRTASTDVAYPYTIFHASNTSLIEERREWCNQNLGNDTDRYFWSGQSADGEWRPTGCGDAAEAYCLHFSEIADATLYKLTWK